MSTQQVVPVTCPNCQAQFTAPIHSIIDGQDPALKAALLQGRLNVAQCPQCGFSDILNSPVLYYDPEKELAFHPARLPVPRLPLLRLRQRLRLLRDRKVPHGNLRQVSKQELILIR